MNEIESTLLVSFIIVLVIILLYNMCPEVFPAEMLRNKYWRKFDRFNKKIVEGFTDDPDMINRPVLSHYNSFTKEKYGKDAIIVGLHYTNWCGYCKQMKPNWFRIKKGIESDSRFSGIKMIENDEEASPTPGVSSYPTIYKYRNGKVIQFKGISSDYDSLREWILAPFVVDTYGAAW